MSSSGSKRGNPSEDEQLPPRKAVRLNHALEYDSDNSNADEEGHQRRGDPNDVQRDWTIKIVHESSETPKTDTYHVHKFVLRYGMRKSDYFDRLFENPDESTDNKCVIRLHPLAAAAFPSLLDYLYKREEHLKIDSNTAAALHHLGKQFEIKHLRWEAKQFWKDDITKTNTLVAYYEQAVIFEDELIVDGIAGEVAKRAAKQTSTQELYPLAKTSDYDFWWKVLGLVDTADEDVSRLVSTFIGENLACQVESIDGEILGKLTASNKLPVISHKGALSLMEVYDALVAENEDTIEHCPDLKERCTSALESQWETVEDTPQTELQRRGPHLVSKLLKRVFQVVSNEMGTLRSKCGCPKPELFQRLAKRFLRRIKECEIKAWMAQASRRCVASTSNLFIAPDRRRTSTLAARSEGATVLEISDLL